VRASPNNRFGAIKAVLKQYPTLATLSLFVAVLLLVSLLPLGRKWFAHLPQELTLASAEVTAELVGDQLMLRWNALVNPWRHPYRDLTFETELKLPLSLRNTGGRLAEIEAVRLLSRRQEGEQIVWEGLWLAEDREWELRQPIEPQIQQHRRPLKPFTLEPYDPPLSLRVDFVPLDYQGLLPQGNYENRLQVRQSGSAGWVEVLHFGFTIPAAFKLEDGSGYRYQYWQPFALDHSPLL
jgi:hypothetical protein